MACLAAVTALNDATTAHLPLLRTQEVGSRASVDFANNL